VEKPECRLCGQKHWANEAHKFPDTKSPQVAHTPSKNRVEASPVKKLVPEIEGLEIEVARLKRLLASANSGECAVCLARRRKDADRAKRYREKNGSKG
jgi:hypothetical protein